MGSRQQAIIETVISKAWADISFRKELTVNPVEAIEKLTGVKVVLPEGKSLVVVDQTDKSKIYVNIPAEPEVESVELTEEQLEDIAGGGQKIWHSVVRDLFPSLKSFLPIY
jgi:ABC-type bacteriocin/lantibiotic exporter with double-glycine peptidase domain